MGLQVKGNVKSATLEMTIIRRGGTREPLGVVGYQSSNKFKHYIVNKWIKFKERRRI
jgi:hypothetical protein